MSSFLRKLRPSRQSKQPLHPPESPDFDKASQFTVTSGSTNESLLSPVSRSSSPFISSSDSFRHAIKGSKSLGPPKFPDGIEVWHDCEDAEVDICFIHGLTGDRNRTWKADDQPEPWPKVLLPPKIPKARILTYGYDAYVIARDGSGASSNRLSDHAHNLINDLAGDRARSNATPTGRPIIFVTHSLGGLVCKKGLLISRNSSRPRHREIFESTRGVIFLGTPHRGSWFADRAQKPVSLLGIFKSSNRALLDVLGTNSELLEDINSGFFEMVRVEPQIRVQCFFEELYTVGDMKVVTKSSATFDGDSGISIHANHREMVRFSSDADTGFTRVLDVLLGWMREPLMDTNVIQAGNFQAQNSVSSPMAAAHSKSTKERLPASVEEVPLAFVEDAVPASMEEIPPTSKALPPAETLEACLHSLAFPSMQARYKDIEPAVSGTCTWFSEHPTYKRWIKSPQGLLWIMGNPGVGKSTLTKFAFEHGRSKAASGDDDPLVLSFFIHARGDELQKTPEGLFRALLHQIYAQEPSSLPQLTATFEENCKRYGRAGDAWRWHQRDLLENLESCLLRLVARRPVWIYIDALDELGKDQAVDTVQIFKNLLRSLGSNCDINNPSIGDASIPNLQFRLCFSCRYFPIINTDQSVMEINVAKENAHDIGTFVDEKLVSATSPQLLSSSIPTLIKEGANGVFLWASLVVAQVSQLHREGAGLKRIEAKIHAIPETLERLYQDMLGVMGAESLWLMQWVCFATRPLRLDELQWALTFDPDSPQHSLHECRESKSYVESLEGVRRQILNLSCGLVEVVSSDWGSYPFTIPPLTWSGNDYIPKVGKCYTVQFIHQSLKDFFLDHGLQALDPTSTTSQQATAVANLRLTKACLYLMTMKEVVEYYATDSTKRVAWQEVTDPDLAESIPREEFNDKLDGLRFPLFTSFPMLHYASAHWHEHAKWACSYGRSVVERSWPFNLWTSPVFIEMANRLNQLLGAEAPYNSSLRQFVQTQSSRAPAPTVLHFAARHGLTAVLDILRDRAASATTTTGSPFTVPFFGAITSTLIEEAARGDHEEILRMLMDGSDEILAGLTLFPSQKDLPLPFASPYLIHNPMPQSAISWAAWHGNLTIAKLLCERGFIDYPSHLSNALCFASERGDMAVIRFLVDKGATFGVETFKGAFMRSKEDVYRYPDRSLLELFSADILHHKRVDSLSDIAAYFSTNNLLRIRLEAFLAYSDQDWRGRLLHDLAGHWYNETISSLDAAAAAQIITQAGPVDVNWSGDRGYRRFARITPLELAAEYRDVPFLQVLVEAGADLGRTCSGSTALIQAVAYRQGNEDVKCRRDDNVGFLLRMGAHPNQADEHGWTPLLHAKGADIYKLLLDAGADIEWETPSGKTALVAAVETALTIFGGSRLYLDGIRYLVSRGANIHRKPLIAEGVKVVTNPSSKPSSRTPDSWSPAIEQCLEVLLDLGADIDMANKEGETPLLIAVKGSPETRDMPRMANWPCIRFLARKGANMCSVPIIGITIDIYERNSRHIVELLLELGADVNAPYNGQTPLQLAIPRRDISRSRWDYRDIGMLLKWGASLEGTYLRARNELLDIERGLPEF
ncbi:hypothetical protein B0T20DRAFT_153255 [Sordaria brevicollis]|uniref:Nephrocystin 3-like N-terminal domain-containing protein n=1 Tax=Sordaria brevicollis TaxID=83679 RepID=A0AAE0UE46_SORBR|nr:hypothetical protein B0T20DRAFT_153255 [Sordaria brevicollis]